MSTSAGTTPRTRVRRMPDRAVVDHEVVHAILDAGLIGHLAIVDDGQPYAVPVAYARWGDTVVFHGSTGSRLMRALAAGTPCCLTVTLLDGLVVARSAFESSMNYRSVMVLGTARALEADEEREALRVITEHLTPGRWALTREPTPKQRAATLVLQMPLDECSAKVRTGDPEDLPEDNDEYGHLWCGVVPMSESFEQPISAAYCDVDVPADIRAWSR